MLIAADWRIPKLRLIKSVTHTLQLQYKRMQGVVTTNSPIEPSASGQNQIKRSRVKLGLNQAIICATKW